MKKPSRHKTAILLAVAILLAIAVVYGLAIFTQNPADQSLHVDVENFQICGTVEMPGLSIDECSETYTIMSKSEFIITNDAGEEVFLSGPLVIRVVKEK